MRNYGIAKFLTGAMLMYCVVFISVIGATGCPQRSIQKAKDASAKVATYANTGVNITRDLYRQELITLAQKDKVADAFVVLANAGIAFDQAVAAIEREFGTNPPKPKIEALFAAFDQQVVGAFLSVLAELKVIGNTAAWSVTIEAIRAAVLIVAGAFGRKAYVERRLA